ncbi:hypothetical protein GCM10010246_26460 [Streptomyces cuspidosporus]|uniref:Uncharacterized protein n=2 Tax=Streptomyces cuspidosporus TaxID=66882 RepID=A0ABN3FYD6_9ACTN
MGDATARLPRFLRTETAMHHELWESCGMDTMEEFREEALVAYVDLDAAKRYRKHHATELDAVHSITNVELDTNLELISYSDNIDRSKFQF